MVPYRLLRGSSKKKKKMKKNIQTGRSLWFFIVIVIVNVSISISSVSATLQLPSKLSIIADNSFEAYYNGVELFPTNPQNFTIDSHNNCSYYSEYCCVPQPGDDAYEGSPEYQRCNWKNSADSYEKSVSNGDVVAIKYYNILEPQYNYTHLVRTNDN